MGESPCHSFGSRSGGENASLRLSLRLEKLMSWQLIRKALPLLASLAILAPLSGADLRKLKEADVLKLIELQIRDDAIIERISQTGLAFKVDEAVLERFHTAGASDSVLTALRGTNPDANAKPAEPANLPLMLWAEQEYN